ncbi:MAG: cobalt ECF transporter T component CbiQ [Phycisphaerae bacterium]|nr:cobalt ECF transporter T component CbiQ [Phycisphaerae bacterium]
MHHAHIDKFAYQDSPIHRLDSRVKFIVVMVFTFLVISLPVDSFGILFCYAVWPFAILVIGRIPLKFAFKQVLIVSPFILFLALSYPFYERGLVRTEFGPWNFEISLGWVKCFTISGKFTVTVLALIALVSTTKFSNLLSGLGRLGFPKLLVMQLGFLYRYIFVLIDKAQHILMARSSRRMRSLGVKREVKVAASMAGSLLIRSIDSAEKINIAMQARGFSGTWKSVNEQKFRRGDLLFALVCGAFIMALHFIVRPFLI